MGNYTLIRKRYVNLFGEECVDEKVIKEIEQSMQLCLPEDFRMISKFYSGGKLGTISHHAIANGGEATNIVDETIRIRHSNNLPSNYIVIGEPEESIIVMDTLTGSVIWCDACDVLALTSGNFHNKPDTWNSYKDFFEYLLLEEEELRK